MPVLLHSFTEKIKKSNSTSESRATEMPTMNDQTTETTIPVIDENVEFARIIDEAELHQIKMANERSEAAMNGMVPSWFSTPHSINSSSELKGFVCKETVNNHGNEPTQESPER